MWIVLAHPCIGFDYHTQITYRQWILRPDAAHLLGFVNMRQCSRFMILMMVIIIQLCLNLIAYECDKSTLVDMLPLERPWPCWQDMNYDMALLSVYHSDKLQYHGLLNVPVRIERIMDNVKLYCDMETTWERRHARPKQPLHCIVCPVSCVWFCTTNIRPSINQSSEDRPRRRTNP